MNEWKRFIVGSLAAGASLAVSRSQPVRAEAAANIQIKTVQPPAAKPNPNCVASDRETVPPATLDAWRAVPNLKTSVYVLSAAPLAAERVGDFNAWYVNNRLVPSSPGFQITAADGPLATLCLNVGDTLIGYGDGKPLPDPRALMEAATQFAKVGRKTLVIIRGGQNFLFHYIVTGTMPKAPPAAPLAILSRAFLMESVSLAEFERASEFKFCKSAPAIKGAENFRIDVA